ITLMKPPSNIKKMLRNSCYDCHSNETSYPWYSKIAPVSWLISEHVRSGRRHLNFSIWSDYKEAKKDVKIEECIEMIKSGEMPMKVYVIFHSNADLILTEKKELIDWFSSKINR
ncbi:MAG: heme-binding domain-containing protein, partial [Melioribacteraceae bacterium]|nr:heme-binding domain-containing protein [Melioribacteraceae bacterium]